MNDQAANDLDGNSGTTQQPAHGKRKGVFEKLTDAVGLTLKTSPTEASYEKSPVPAPLEDDYFMEAIDDAVNPRLTKEVRAAVPLVTYVSPATMAAIGDLAMVKPVELAAQISAEQKKWEDLMKKAMSFAPREASNGYAAYIENSKRLALESADVSHCDGKSLEDFQVEYRHKFAEALNVAKACIPRARALVQPHIRRFVSEVRVIADQAAINEQSRYERLGLKWHVSPYVATLYRAAEIVETFDGQGNSPKDCAQYLDLSATPAESPKTE